MTDREKVESYIPLVKFIAGVCGPRCEVALHYMVEDIAHSIIAIENGYVTGRKVGDGFVDFATDKLLQDPNRHFMLNKSGKTTNDNKVLRFSTFKIHSDNDPDEVIGYLNATIDISDYVKIRNIITSELFIDNGYYTDGNVINGGMHALSLSDTLESIYQHALEQTGCSDTDMDSVSKDDKMRIISILKENNLFEIKGAVNFIAKKINMSEPSVYRYLKEIKNNGA